MPSKNFEAQYQLLFTLGFLPGIVLPLFTGALVDQIGSRVCLLALSLTCFVGQVIAALGVENESVFQRSGSRGGTGCCTAVWRGCDAVFKDRAVSSFDNDKLTGTRHIVTKP